MNFPAKAQGRREGEKSGTQELMKRGFLIAIVAILLALTCQGCVMICPSKPHFSATGKIQGRVIDGKGRPVGGVEVMAIYMRGWTTWYPPVPNAFVAGKAVTDEMGRFLIVTKKRVDGLSVSSRNRKGSVNDVHEADNLIILKP